VSNPERKKRARPRRPELSCREVRFAEHYAEHGVAAEAYRAAGYPDGTTSTPRVLAWRLLRKPAVRGLIHELRREALDAARVTVNRLAQALARIAFANRADLFDERGCLLPKDQWPADVAATVEAIENEELFEVVSQKGQPRRRELRGYARKVRTAKRTEAIKLLMQWRGMIRDAEAEAMGREIQQLRELLNKATGERV
jgi:phage terminase small subunit